MLNPPCHPSIHISLQNLAEQLHPFLKKKIHSFNNNYCKVLITFLPQECCTELSKDYSKDYSEDYSKDYKGNPQGL